jgi:hypothetical protein
MNFSPYLPYFLTSVGEICVAYHIMLLWNFRFHEGQCSESHTLVKGVNVFVSITSMWVSYLSEIQYERSAHNTIEHLRVSWKFVQGMSFLYAYKWNYIYACTLKSYDILK